MDGSSARPFEVAFCEEGLCPVVDFFKLMMTLFLSGNLNCPFEENDVTKAIINDTLSELSKGELIAHVNTCLFRSMYLRTMFLNRPDDESDKNWCNELLSETYFERELVKCIHDFAVICSLHEGYAFVSTTLTPSIYKNYMIYLFIIKNFLYDYTCNEYFVFPVASLQTNRAK